MPAALYDLFFFLRFFFLSPPWVASPLISTSPSAVPRFGFSPSGFQFAGIATPLSSPKTSFRHSLSRFFLPYLFLSFFFLSGSLKVASFLRPTKVLRSWSVAVRISSGVRP